MDWGGGLLGNCVGDELVGSGGEDIRGGGNLGMMELKSI